MFMMMMMTTTTMMMMMAVYVHSHGQGTGKKHVCRTLRCPQSAAGKQIGQTTQSHAPLTVPQEMMSG